MHDFRNSLFDLVKQFQFRPKKVKDKALFTFDTWIITEPEIRFLRSLGVKIKSDDKPKKRWLLRVVFYLKNCKRAPEDWIWFNLEFGKGFIMKVHDLSSYRDFKLLRIKSVKAND